MSNKLERTLRLNPDAVSGLWLRNQLIAVHALRKVQQEKMRVNHPLIGLKNLFAASVEKDIAPMLTYGHLPEVQHLLPHIRRIHSSVRIYYSMMTEQNVLRELDDRFFMRVGTNIKEPTWGTGYLTIPKLRIPIHEDSLPVPQETLTPTPMPLSSLEFIVSKTANGDLVWHVTLHFSVKRTRITNKHKYRNRKQLTFEAQTLARVPRPPHTRMAQALMEKSPDDLDTDTDTDTVV